MKELKESVSIIDNKLTNDLRLRCSKIISNVKRMPLQNRRLHYEELSSLLSDILKNKNQNFEKETKELLKNCYLKL